MSNTLDQVRATAERLSLCYLEAEVLPEAVVLVDGGELTVRYAVEPEGVFLRAVLINGIWHDPIRFGLSASAIRCIENECIAGELEEA